MAGKTSSKATRRWFDPRLAIGLGLVVASLAGVVAVVSASDRTTLVYSAGSTLAVGDTVTASELTPMPVRLGALASHYVTTGSLPPGELKVTRTIAAGELVPTEALTTRAATDRTRVVLTVAGPLAETVGPSALVDVWGAQAAERGRFGTPAVLVAGARVVRVVEPQGIVADGRSVSVELQVPKGKTAAVLEAQTRQDAIMVLPADASTDD